MKCVKWLCYCLILLAQPLNAVDVVVHPAVSAEQLSSAQLRAIFSMRQSRWPDGTAIRVFVLASDDSTHLNFSRQRLQMFPYQLDAIWNRQRFSGIGSFPTQLASEQEMQQALQDNEGAIGYLSTGNIPATLKVIRLHEN
ncbi:substrate-binding domain-containing protein [Arsukibacterium sp.]|uniref:substrate-binding domain-containing protein n=1 Tax=Arsukibacterium sp. TaxID=1977258 RepID=UPI002FD9E9C3